MGKIRLLKCSRCGWEWATRKVKDPYYCPECHSPYWDKPRIRKWMTKARKYWKKEKL